MYPAIKNQSTNFKTFLDCREVHKLTDISLDFIKIYFVILGKGIHTYNLIIFMYTLDILGSFLR